jgi:hypothetical protein
MIIDIETARFAIHAKHSRYYTDIIFGLCQDMIKKDSGIHNHKWSGRNTDSCQETIDYILSCITKESFNEMFEDFYQTNYLSAFDTDTKRRLVSVYNDNFNIVTSFMPDVRNPKQKIQVHLTIPAIVELYKKSYLRVLFAYDRFFDSLKEFDHLTDDIEEVKNLIEKSFDIALEDHKCPPVIAVDGELIGKPLYRASSIFLDFTTSLEGQNYIKNETSYNIRCYYYESALAQAAYHQCKFDYLLEDFKSKVEKNITECCRFTSIKSQEEMVKSIFIISRSESRLMFEMERYCCWCYVKSLREYRGIRNQHADD